MNFSIKNTSLTVLSYGSTVILDNKYYTNKAICEVTNHLNATFDIKLVTLLAGKNSSLYDNKGKPIYNCILNSDIEFILLSKSFGISLKSFKPFIKNFYKIFKSIYMSDIIFIYLPNNTYTIITFISLFLNKKYFIYVGSDWKDISRNSKSVNVLKKFLWNYLYEKMSNILYKRAKFIIAAGNKICNDIKEYNDNVFETIPSVSFKKISNKYDIKNYSDEIIIFFAGPINERKGITYLVESVAILIDRGKKIKLWLAGSEDVKYKKLIEQLIINYNIHNNIKFFGFIKNEKLLMRLYQKAHFFVIPSKAEGFPRSIYEAMMMGVPVISSNLDSVKGNINPKDIIKFVPIEDAEGIANSIEFLIENYKIREYMISESYKFIKNKFVEKKHYEQISDLIQKYI